MHKVKLPSRYAVIYAKMCKILPLEGKWAREKCYTFANAHQQKKLYDSQQKMYIHITPSENRRRKKYGIDFHIILKLSRGKQAR